MDFDEYDYLEKTVENPEVIKDSINGDSGKTGDRDGRDRSKSSRHRSDEDGHGLEHRSKRARSIEEPREKIERGERGRASRDRSEQDRDRSRRGSSHHRSPDYRSRDLDRVEKDRYRSSRERHDRSSRDTEKDRDHDRDRGDKNGKDRMDKDIERDKARDRDRESERERERSRRSMSHSERIRGDREKEREREKSKDMELRERERERELRERESRRFKERKEEAVEPEADPERDQRTVFAYQICLKADERDVYEFFSRAGKVRDVRLIMDRNSRRSKGVGYIEFYDAMSVPMAIALSGQLLLGQPVMVKPSEAEKNLVQSNATVAVGPGGFIGPYSGGARRLYVGNLHFNITEDQLRQVFEPFGPVELVQLPTDPETGQCKGFGFVQFARLEDARAAQSLNGQLDIAGRIIKVSAVSDQVGMQDIGGNAGDFDDDDGGGLSLNARSRAILMQKLDRSGIATSVAGTVSTTPLANTAVNLPTVPGISPSVTPLGPPIGQTGMPGFMGLQGPVVAAAPAVVAPAGDPVGSPSDCLLLKNMFDPKNETEPDFDLDIKEDVQDECSKFGTVKHIFVDKHSAGHVYLRFASAMSAINAQRALHGRWFAGKMITATFMLTSSYEARFPESK